MVSKKQVSDGQITEKELLKWNNEVNKEFEMKLLRNHKNPIIRFQEHNRIRKLISMLNVHKNDVVADIGCEDGYISSLIAPKCRSIYCVDIDYDMLKKAKSAIKSDNAYFIQSNAENIKINDSTFDRVLCAAIMEHIPNPKKLIDELLRITKPNGTILIMVPNERLILLIKKILRVLGLSFLLGNLAKGLAKGHLHIFNRQKIIKLLKNEPIIIKKISYDYPFFTNYFILIKKKG
jgi:ubiquinone/menaquinone biosynthesis C-methylase UbiE